MVNISELLRLAAMRWPERECLVFGDQSYTYSEFGRLVETRAARLEKLGIGVAQPVLIIGENSSELLATYLALASLGALNIPLSSMSTVSEASQIALRARASVLIFSDGRSDFANSVLDVTEGLSTLVPLEPQGAEGNPQGSRSLRTAPVGGDSPAMVIFTSGSTGSPKGCIKTHGNLVAHMVNAQIAMPRVADDRELYVIPLSGIGLVNFALGGFLVGSLLVLDRFYADALFPALEAQRITRVFLPPTMLHAALAVEGSARVDLRTLTRVDTGYEMSLNLRAQILERFGAIVHYGYGSSEGTISYANVEQFESDPQCVGQVAGLDELAVVLPAGEPAAAGVTGEIVGRGPSVFAGYFGDDELTAETLRDGWYHTGDLGWMDERADLHFAGRLKDMIKTGGMNVAAAEVEAAIVRHPSVSEVSVVGIPDDRWGEAVVAAVVAAPGQRVSEEELQEFARDELPGYKRPKRYVLLDALPTNPGGKIAKGVLRESILNEK